MFLPSIIRFLHKGLDLLIEELEGYENEENIWRIGGEIKNSAGILTYHLIGNLNHFIGQEIGKNGYQRNRPLEFSIKYVPRTELIEMIQATKQMISTVLSRMEASELTQPSPVAFTTIRVDNMLDYLLHLHGHLQWHLGQINYHRRLV